MLEEFRKSFGVVARIFTLIVILLSGYELMTNIRVISGLKLIIYLIFIVIGVSSHRISQGLYFRLKFINYIIPYSLSLLIIFLLVGGLNTYLSQDYLNFKKLISAYTIFYIIYLTYMILQEIKNKDRIRF